MGKIADKVKSGAKKTWKWVKAHPGETCLMVGSAIIGGVTGSKLGHRTGFKTGYSIGWKNSSNVTWANHCEDYGWDPSISSYNYSEMAGTAAPAKKWIEGLSKVDPERLMSGRLVYDDTVAPEDNPPIDARRY